jgi:hypothetical protein
LSSRVGTTAKAQRLGVSRRHASIRGAGDEQRQERSPLNMLADVFRLQVTSLMGSR